MQSIVITYLSRPSGYRLIVYCCHGNCCLQGRHVILATEKQSFHIRFPNVSNIRQMLQLCSETFGKAHKIEVLKAPEISMSI